MKNFLSPLFIRTNTVSGERICIGLFVASEDQPYFAWSEAKLKLADRLVGGDTYAILKKSFLALEKELATTNQDSSYAVKYTYNYFSYLEAYNNGLLEFGKPNILPKPVTPTQYRSLYKMYVGEAMVVRSLAEKSPTLYQKVKHYLQHPVIAEKADRNYRISETVIGTIYRPQLVDFISYNGSLLTGYSIDFTAQPATIENRLYEFRALVEGLSAFAREHHLEGPGTYIAYFEPPREEAQTSIFQNALHDKSKNFELQPVEEMTSISNRLARNHYRKFSELISHAPTVTPRLVG